MNSRFSANNPPRDAFVLLPCSSLEDFPTQHMGQQAAGLLIGWSVLWHPEIIALTGKMPSWHRADAPPEDLNDCIIVVPEASESDLPTGRVMRAHDQQHAVVRIIGGQSRREIADSLLDKPLACDDRVADFYALAYAYLQVQLMTLQLRYSSNLDDAYFSQELIAAANAWRSGDDAKTSEALHQCFDLLAQERDHSFSADPALIDLTLLANTTIGNSLGDALQSQRPDNFLVEFDLLQQIAQNNPSAFECLRERVAARQVGIAGGTHGNCLEIDLLTHEAAVAQLASARQRYIDLIGNAPDAFACFAGGLPGDLPGVLTGLGYAGAIFADFAGGGESGQEEAKLMWQSGDAEIPALCCTPLDAADPQVFLGLGPRLGEAVDAGQIATALLVHWPGNACFAYEDLRRASSWGLVMGKFQTLHDYFAQGERPYHSFQPSAGNTDGQWLAHRVHHQVADPLSSQAASIRAAIADQMRHTCDVFANLIGSAPRTADKQASASNDPGKPSDPSDPSDPRERSMSEISQRLATSLGATLRSDADNANVDATTRLVLNPHSHAVRERVPLSGFPPAPGGPIYSSAQTDQTSIALVDVPSCGFAVAQSGNQAPKPPRLFRRRRPLADAEGLRNDFIDVTLNPQTGGVASVYTPQVRSNRFSWQLVHCQPEHLQERCSSMHLISSDLLENNPVDAHIRNRVEIRSADGQIAALANIDYRLQLGSRVLHIDVLLEPRQPLAEDPWRNYLGARIAWPAQAAVPQRILRDQLRSGSARNLISSQGVLIDQSDQSILVSGNGLPAHRCVGSQMLDTLLLVSGETQLASHLSYGFDIKNPVAASRQSMAPAITLACEHSPQATSGWLFHIDCPNVIASRWRLHTDEDGQDHVELSLIETAGRKSNTTLTCFATIQSAQEIDQLGQPLRTLPANDDRINIKIAAYQTRTLRLSLAHRSVT